MTAELGERDARWRCEGGVLRARLEDRNLPACEAWLAFEETYSGLRDYGIARWLEGAGHGERAVVAHGRWAIRICVRDLDWSIFLDEAGTVLHDTTSSEVLIPIATSFDTYLARDALWAEARAALGAHFADPWVELESTDPALVAALDLPRVDAASDALCGRHRGGDFVACVVHPSAAVDRGKLRLYARDVDALVRRAIDLAARPPFRAIPVTVFGWPNARTADARRALADALPGRVRERNDYIGPLELSDFVR